MNSIVLKRTAQAKDDPLPSWNDGPVKSRIMDFVQKATEVYSPSERVATFDHDGTLWIEKPHYIQGVYNFYQTIKLASEKDDSPDTQPFRVSLTQCGEELANFAFSQYGTLSQKVQTGMTPQKFQSNIRRFLREKQHPRFKQPYNELVYQPMIELIDFLRKNEFCIYLCSGGDVDFLRTVSMDLYQIEPSEVIGSSWSYQKKYTPKEDHKMQIVRAQPSAPVNLGMTKATNIHTHIGKRPILAVGNSNEDLEMLEYSESRKKTTLQLLLKHDDPIREYKYNNKAKKVQRIAKTYGWAIISMANDFKTIFKNRKD